MLPQYQIARLQEIFQQGPELSLEELARTARTGMQEVELKIAEERSRSPYIDEFRTYKLALKLALCEAARCVR